MKMSGVVAALGLAAAGLMHVVWVFSPWPLASRADYARTVVGVAEADLPSGPLTATVAALLFLAAYLVAARSTAAQPGWMIRTGPWVVAAALLGRGLVGVLVSGLDLTDVPSDYVLWDLRLYSPLCLLLGGLTLFVAKAAVSRAMSQEEESR
ncbi:DUF3995 domain-containing protein [Streptomyces sp. NPDC001816]|uniref:DUF3995 domain-containing protein n=1 Tax=Streptomyces sp. NPDC001816 TaxID=3364612 RepID=UPI0036820C0E